jgi:hypothetical protein
MIESTPPLTTDLANQDQTQNTNLDPAYLATFWTHGTNPVCQTEQDFVEQLSDTFSLTPTQDIDRD